ncbi:hypothetical protein GZH53_09365 [Flavihumibacter sp. R14]|nr:hypothetical protein [Flavihumibacter soli]
MSSVKCRLLPFLLAVICCLAEPGYALVEYKKGYYFKGAEKVEGYVYFSFDNYESFFFKKELNGKSQKMKLNDCDSFAFENKKFVRIARLTLKVGLSNKTADQAFAEHAIEGPVNLYRVYSSTHAGYTRGGVTLNTGAGKVSSVFLEKNNSKSYILASKDPLKFQNELTDFFNDRIDIVQKITSGYYNLSNIEEMVTDYNGHK